MNRDSFGEDWVRGEQETVSDLQTLIEAEEVLIDGVSDHTLAFAALASPTCRYTIYHFLLTSETSASVREVARGIRTLVDEQSQQQVVADDETLRSLLVERTIPQLERVGAVEYDSRSNTVRYYRQPFIEEYAEHAAYQELSVDV